MVGRSEPLVGLSGSRTGFGQLLRERAGRRPGEADHGGRAVLGVGPHSPVQRRVGRVGRVARVRRRVRDDVVDRAREGRVLGDLDAVAARAEDRRPLELRGRGVHGLVVDRALERRRRRLLGEALRVARERVRRDSAAVGVVGGEDRPVVEGRLVRVADRLRRAAAGGVGGDAGVGVVDDGREVGIARDEHVVALGARAPRPR